MPSQSSNIGFFLIAGFIVYITVRGELPAYLCVIGFGANCATPPASPTVVSQNQAPVPYPPVTSTINVPSYSPPSLPSLPSVPSFPSSSTITPPPDSTSPPSVMMPVTTTITVPQDTGTTGACDQYNDTDPNVCADVNNYAGNVVCNDNGFGDCE